MEEYNLVEINTGRITKVKAANPEKITDVLKLISQTVWAPLNNIALVIDKKSYTAMDIFIQKLEDDELKGQKFMDEVIETKKIYYSTFWQQINSLSVPVYQEETIMEKSKCVENMFPFVKN